jgi:arylamine N-acetyltransferase
MSCYYGSASKVAILSESDARIYLRRIGLEGASLGSPSFDTLQTLVLEHQLHIPYDTTSLHVPDWRDDAPISFGRGQGMQLGVRNFQRIVLGHQGGFCFALNSLFAALLRSLGFRVSEVGGRPNLLGGQDHAQVGYEWGSINHMVLLVDYPGSCTRWLVDVGFGGGAPTRPIELKDGATAPSLLPHERSVRAVCGTSSD